LTPKSPALPPHHDVRRKIDMTLPVPADWVASGPPSRPPLRSLMAILFCAVAGTASEIFLKRGAAETASQSTLVPWLGLSGLESKWVWLGIVFTILSFLAWVRAVRIVPLSIAFTLSNVIHVFIPLSCWLFLGEAVSPRRWLGITLVVIGLAIVARPFARLDEKLEKAL
jgi:drug/metabolite transporter (DMT)-like permease